MGSEINGQREVSRLHRVYKYILGTFVHVWLEWYLLDRWINPFAKCKNEIGQKNNDAKINFGRKITTHSRDYDNLRNISGWFPCQHPVWQSIIANIAT